MQSGRFLLSRLSVGQRLSSPAGILLGGLITVPICVSHRQVKDSPLFQREQLLLPPLRRTNQFRQSRVLSAGKHFNLANDPAIPGLYDSAPTVTETVGAVIPAQLLESQFQLQDGPAAEPVRSAQVPKRRSRAETEAPA